MKKLCLNLGCQIHYFDGWTNVDIVCDDPNIKVDLVSDVANLDAIEDCSAEFIYCGHVIEHFYPDTVKDAVREWYRVLNLGGKLVIVTPDCGAVYKDYAAGKIVDIEGTWQQTYGRIYSYDSAPERHHIAFDGGKLMDLVSGEDMPRWSGVQWMDFNNPPQELVPFMDTHISRGAYQLAIILTK